MRNNYGQTNILKQYLASQPKQHHTGLGTALRLGGAALAAYGQNRKEKADKTALADALRGFNTPALDGSGPTMEAAAAAPIADPDQMAALLSNPSTAPLAQSLLGKALAGPEKPESYTLSPGEQRYRGGELVASVPPTQKPQSAPASVQEYNFAVENGFKGSFTDFVKAKRAPGVVVNMGDIGSSVAPGTNGAPTVPVPSINPYEGLPPKVQDDVAKDVFKRAVQSFEKDEEALAGLRQTMALFDQFESLMERQQTGGFLRRLPLAGSIEGSFDPEIQEMQAIADRVTPLMRQGMPGAASDRDVRMFRGAAPGPDKLPEVNRALIQAHRMQVQNATDRLAFRQEYLAQNKTLNGADEQWNNYLNANRIFSNEDPDAPKLNPKRRTWREYFSGKSDDLSGSIGGMDMEQLQQLDPATLTEAEKEAAANRWDELNGG